MSKKVTLVIAVLEAAVLLVMKASQWQQNKRNKPNAAKAHSVGGKRVVQPSSPRYDERSRGDKNAAYFPASGGAADEKIHEKPRRKLRLRELPASIKRNITRRGRKRD